MKAYLRVLMIQVLASCPLAARSGLLNPLVYRDSIDMGPYRCGSAGCMTIVRNMLYFCGDGDGSSSPVIWSVDTSDPQNLLYVSRWGCCYKASGFSIVENRLYLAHWFHYLHTLDISTPGHFTFIGDFDVEGPASWGVHAIGNRAYVTEGAAENPESFRGCESWTSPIRHTSPPSREWTARRSCRSGRSCGAATRITATATRSRSPISATRTTPTSWSWWTWARTWAHWLCEAIICMQCALNSIQGIQGPACISNQEVPIDGTVWHTYRITTQAGQFRVYVDESPSPILSGNMISSTTRARIWFGSGASAGTQDIYFDCVRYTSGGDLLPGEGDGGGQVSLTWTNPSDPDFARTVVRYKTTPIAIGAGPTDGSLLVNKSNSPGTADSYTHTGAGNGITYYYSAFAHDGIPNYASGATASAMPSGEDCFFDAFSYPNGNLSGPESFRGGWTGGATTQIQVVDQTVRIDGPNSRNLARWYGSGTSAKGRIGGTGVVTDPQALTGNWDTLEVRIHTATDQSEFIFNGTSIGTKSHSSEGAGDTVGRLMFERMDNSGAAGHYLYFDDLLLSEADTIAFGPAQAKMCADNTPVTMTVGVVSAVFADSFYVQCALNSPESGSGQGPACGACGINVVGAGSGLQIGQSVTVQGTILTNPATRERYISATQIR